MQPPHVAHHERLLRQPEGRARCRPGGHPREAGFPEAIRRDHHAILWYAHFHQHPGHVRRDGQRAADLLHQVGLHLAFARVAGQAVDLPEQAAGGLVALEGGEDQGMAGVVGGLRGRAAQHGPQRRAVGEHLQVKRGLREAIHAPASQRQHVQRGDIAPDVAPAQFRRLEASRRVKSHVGASTGQRLAVLHNLEAMRLFSGQPHRCEVMQLDGHTWLPSTGGHALRPPQSVIMMYLSGSVEELRG